MGAHGVDVQLSKEAVRQLPFSIETKKYAKFSVYALFKQAQDNTIEGTKPLLIIEGDRQKPLVVLDLDDFLELL